MKTQTVTQTVYTLLQLEALAKGGSVQNSLVVSAINYTEFDSLKENYVLVDKTVLNITLPDNLDELALSGMEDALQKMRAEHQMQQQKLVDQIASLRMLTAPKEGELMDDRDLRNVETVSMVNKFDDAEDADFSKIEIPF